MTSGKLLVLFAVCCLWAQGAVAEGSSCEPWYGHGGCDAKCKAPWGKCCAVKKTVCFAGCKHKDGYCVHDPDFCETKLVKKCKDVPKKVCEPVCKKVKVEVCKKVPVKKCYDGPDECYYDTVCKNVPKKVCKTVKKCDKKKVCGGGSKADADAKALGLGDPAYGATDTATVSKPGSATAYGGASASGSRAAYASSSASARSGGGCKYVDDCKDVHECDTVYKKECEKKRVCKPGKKICKTDYVEKCEYVWKNDCSEKKCYVKHEEVCEVEKVKVCKDPVKCYGIDCGYGYKCNPHCCPVKKVPVCLK